MTIRPYGKDPRTREQRQADAGALERFERGRFLRVAPSVERAAIERVTARNRERRELVARLGRELGVFRRLLGVSQDEVARAIGTRKANVSRVESGRYGGITLERFLAMIEAIGASAGEARLSALPGRPRRRRSPRGRRAGSKR